MSGLSFKKITSGILENELDEFIGISRGIPHDNWDKSSYLMDLKGKWDFSLASYLGDKLAGYIIASQKTADNIHIHRFVVSPDNQGMGVGHSLLNRFEKLIAGNASSISLKVYVDNTRAIKFYRDCGFSVAEKQDMLVLLIKHLHINE